MPMIGTSGFILIIVVALVLFGPKKLPELGRAFGQTLKEFKSGTKELMGETEDAGKSRETDAARKENGNG